MSDDYKFQASPIVNGAMVNIRAASADEFADAVRFIAEHAVDLAQWLTTIQNAGNVTGTFGAHTVAATTTVRPTESAPAENGQAKPSCRHGERKYVAKSNWKAWMCPAPQGATDKCKPLDAVTGELWK